LQNNETIKAKPYVEGTVKFLTEQNINVNGVLLDKASLGVLMALGFGDVVGVEERPVGTRGRAAKIYRIQLEQECFFSVAPQEEAEENFEEAIDNA
jgi:hypothetical protein